jgi:tetratricopeptide (TPR) repeat protein
LLLAVCWQVTGEQMSTNATNQRSNHADAKTAPADDRKKIRLYGVAISALLLIGVALVFAQVRHFDFVVIDDGEYVTDNAQIKTGLNAETVKWSFTHTVAANWHPLTMLSHALDCQLFGQNAGAHHLVNVMLHAVDTVLLFWFLFLLLGRTEPRLDRVTLLWLCGVVAALFGLHPMRAESVAWISERKDVLSAFFFLLTLMTYLRYVRLHQQKQPVAVVYISILAFYGLGLLAKPMLVTLPFVLLLIDFWPLRRIPKSSSLIALITEKIPMFLLCGIVSVVTFLSQKRSGSVVALESFPLSERLANVVVSYARYLSKSFVPINLCAYYPRESWKLWQVGGAIVLMLTLTAFATASFRKRPYIFVGWFWFVGMLVPVIGFAQVGAQSMADRYAYLPHIGLFLAFVLWLHEMGKKPVLVALSVVSVLAAVASAKQVSYWRDSEVLFDRTLRLTTNNVSAEYFMALALETKHKNTESIPYFESAIRGNPENIKAITHLGRIFASQGKLEQARQQFEAALRVDSDLPLTHKNLGDVLMGLGKREEATEQYIKAMQGRSEIPETHFDLSNLLASKHDFDGAIAELKTAIEMKPNWPVALNSLAWILATQPNARLRNGPEAVRLAEQAVALTGSKDAGMLDTLAATYAEAGQFPNAIKAAESAIDIAKNSNQTNLVTEISGRLQLYKAGTAFRE